MKTSLKNSASNAENTINYLVEPSDTLESIASRFCMKLDDLKRLNSIDNDYRVHLGENLLVYKKGNGPSSNVSDKSHEENYDVDDDFYHIGGPNSTKTESGVSTHEISTTSVGANGNRAHEPEYNHETVMSTEVYYFIDNKLIFGKMILYLEFLGFIPKFCDTEMCFNSRNGEHTDSSLNISYRLIVSINADDQKSISLSKINSIMGNLRTNELILSGANPSEDPTASSAFYFPKSVFNLFFYLIPFKNPFSKENSTAGSGVVKKGEHVVQDDGCEKGEIQSSKGCRRSNMKNGSEFGGPNDFEEMYTCVDLDFCIEDEGRLVEFKSLNFYIESSRFKLFYEEILYRVEAEKEKKHEGGKLGSLVSMVSSNKLEIYEDLLSNLSESSNFIEQKDKIIELIYYLPSMLKYRRWVLLYSTKVHGMSLQTLYHRTKEKGPSVIFIEDYEGYRFGAFLSESIRPKSNNYYCSGETFLFALHPNFKVYLWSGLNEYFVYSSKDSIALGGGSGKFGIYLNSDLDNGMSSVCETFTNDVLSSKEQFKCSTIEIWGFET